MNIKKFKKIMLPIMLLNLIGMPACATVLMNHGNVGDIQGDGNMVEKTVNIDHPWQHIKIKNVKATLIIDQKPSNVVGVTIDQNLVRLLSIKSENGIMTINCNDNKSISSKKEIIFRVGSDLIEGISFAGENVIKSTGTLTGDALSINGAGSGKVELDLQYDNVAYDGSGDISISLTGKCQSAEFNLSGDCDLYAKNLQVDNIMLSLFGSGGVEVYGSKSISINASGFYNITYWGNGILDNNIIGEVDVNKGK